MSTRTQTLDLQIQCSDILSPEPCAESVQGFRRFWVHEPREPRSSFITLISETNAFSPVYCDAGNVERTSCIENQGVTGYLLLLEVLDFQSLISSRHVMRIKKNTNKGIISRSNTKCSELTSQDLCGRQ